MQQPEMSRTPREKKGHWACDACRLLKVKCTRGPNQTEICQKCIRSGAACTWTARPTRSRKLRPPGPSSRISALETKIDYLLAVIEEQSVSASTLVTLADSTSGDEDRIPTLPDATSSTERSDSPSSELFERFGLTEDMAEAHLRHFRSMTLYFPFIIIPASTSARTLACEKPLLCLAILTASTSQNRSLQSELEATLRKSLVEKIMLTNEKSLELLSALLVYLGWYHFYYVPKRDSISQFMWLAISICEELGLGQTPEDAARRQMRVRLDHYELSSQPGAKHDLFFSAEARRLYLGTYFLINCHSWGFAEKARLNDIEHVVSCATSLAQENEYATDTLILCLVQMQSVAQRYHDVFTDIESFEGDAVQLHAQLDHVEETLTNMKASLSQVLQQSALVDLTYYFALSYAYEADTINPLVRKRQYIKCPDLMVAVMYRCLNACKGFFEAFFTIPASEYAFLSGSQWLALVYAITLLYKLSLGLPRLPLWDVQVARSIASLEIYINQCCKTMAFAHRIGGSDVQDHDCTVRSRRDMYSLQIAIWDDVLQEYRRRKDLLPKLRMAPSSVIVHRRALLGFGADTLHGGGINATLDSGSEDGYRDGAAKVSMHPCPAYNYWR